ncbi:MAG: GntP family permease [Lachnospiraceae bacterium]|nr:GntP family permease [Lachnospiraceae bacterium]
MSLLGIFLGLIVLVILTFKDMSILWVAPVAAMVTALCSGFNLLDAFLGYTNDAGTLVGYMPGLANYVRSWFPVFALGAIFGKLMDVTGAARAIGKWLSKVIGAKRAVAAVVLTCGLLTYGGISLFVVVFVMYPLGVELFREANLSRRILPGAISAGAFTFSMTAMPGSPQLTNIIPTQYFGTDALAAPIIGIVCAIIMAGCSIWWLTMRANKLAAAGEVFTEPTNLTDTGADKDLPSTGASFIPPLVIIVGYNVMTRIPSLGLNTTQALVLGEIVGVILLIVLMFNRFGGVRNIIDTVNAGAQGSMAAILNTASGVGFGAVVQIVPGFQQLAQVMTGATGVPPLLAEALGIQVLAGATGSSSGGLSIGLAALQEQLLAAAEAANISPQAFHRVASIAAGGLDSLPQCGAVITLLAVTGFTNKEAYFDIGMVCCVFPIIACIVSIIMGSIGIV